MSADDHFFDDFETVDDSFAEPVHEPALEPARTPKQSSPGSIRLVKLGTPTIKDFIKDYPNSFIIVSTRSKGLLRLDAKRGTKYEVMLVPSTRDELEHIENKQLTL